MNTRSVLGAIPTGFLCKILGKLLSSPELFIALPNREKNGGGSRGVHVLPIVDSGFGLRNFIYVKTNICGRGIHILQSISSLIKCRCQRIKVDTGSRSLYSVIFLFKFYRIKLYFYFSISKQMPNKRIQPFLRVITVMLLDSFTSMVQS